MADTNRVRELFLAALDLAERERAAYLDRACADPEVRDQVESLLLHHARADGFLDVPISSTSLFTNSDSSFPAIEGFEIEREIGRGGMGVVYLAHDLERDLPVALKVLVVGLSLSETGLARFRTEALTTSRLEHPAIVPVVRYGLDREVPYIASTYIEGSTLARELDPDLRLGLAPVAGDFVAIAQFLAVLADALAHAHAQKVLHRDVKPANILIDLQGRPYLTDFGLARDLDEAGHTRSGELAGTLAYMSPEQALGRWREVDHRSDGYALAVVFFEMLTGHRPFDTPSAAASMRTLAERRVRTPRALIPTLPRELWTLCAKGLESDPRDRFANLADLARDLEAFAEGRPIRTRPGSFPTRVRRLVRRRRRASVVLAAALVLAGTGIGLGISAQRDDTTPVRVTSSQPGAEVLVQRLVAQTGDYGPLQALGTTPLSTRLPAGLVRFVVRDREGGLAELSRSIPARDALSGEARYEVHAERILGDEVLADMVHIEHFAVDRHEVTVDEFRRFLEATRRPLPSSWSGLDLDRAGPWPAVGIDWASAQAYAEWAGKRLLTLAEWRRAAGGPDERPWPWGHLPAPADSVRAWACLERVERGAPLTPELFLARACQAGSHPRDRSPEGVVDVLGSAIEWVETPAISSRPDGGYSVDGNLRLAVGAGWSVPSQTASLHQSVVIGTNVDPSLDIGFRCARTIVAADEASP